MSRVMLVVVLLAAVMVAGCAASSQDLPQEQRLAADEIGPQTVVNVQGIAIFQCGPLPDAAALARLAETVTVTITESEQTADGSQQGSTEQEAEQAGGTLGAVDQRPEAEIPVDVDVNLPGGGAGLPDLEVIQPPE